MKNVCILVLLSAYVPLSSSDYWAEREKLINYDKQFSLGSKLNLTEKEKRVSDILMTYKFEEYDLGFLNPNDFLAGQHFFKVKDKIEKSKVFDIIQRVPKGSSLHSHDEALVSQEYLYNLTYRDNLYICIEKDQINLHFFRENNISDSCNWTLVSDLRRSDKNFDSYLKSKISMICDDPDKTYSNSNTVWKAFQTIFRTIGGLLTYKPIFEEYFYEALLELYEDNVKYLEFRGFLPEVYDIDGNIYSKLEVLGMYVHTFKKFQTDHPDFFGARFIYAPNRHVDNATMDEYVNTFRKLRKKYPGFVAGFDLVGQEDAGNPLISFLPQLEELQKMGANFFFHAGETNWEGESTDFNILDAILLNTTRIGHSYAILKHPIAAQLVKEKDIALEICPISNQVLKLVTDLRNHPGVILIANGFPVVISADDPSFWGSRGLSYDWYMAFMALAGKNSDLRFLKQLAINSIKYSSLDENKKKLAMNEWESDWNLFIEAELQRQYPYDLPNVINVIEIND
ncbi:adenosine deaminase 2-like [Diorhabda carinulata]|uniref:adenosine deaminase 2-like n=1 Tax=Diorhabda carinulata TaxID=1163345 RepID=UPI0025A1DE9E|nr:adenosine deaminase 2-like [Diorhabda carinulata]